MLEVIEKRKRGRPRTTWRRQVEESVKKAGLKILRSNEMKGRCESDHGGKEVYSANFGNEEKTRLKLDRKRRSLQPDWTAKKSRSCENFFARESQGYNKTSTTKSCRSHVYHSNMEIPSSDYVKDTINKLHSMFSVYNSSQKSKNQALIDIATQKNAIKPYKIEFDFESKNSLIILLINGTYQPLKIL